MEGDSSQIFLQKGLVRDDLLHEFFIFQHLVIHHEEKAAVRVGEIVPGDLLGEIKEHALFVVDHLVQLLHDDRFLSLNIHCVLEHLFVQRISPESNLSDERVSELLKQVFLLPKNVIDEMVQFVCELLAVFDEDVIN